MPHMKSLMFRQYSEFGSYRENATCDSPKQTLGACIGGAWTREEGEWRKLKPHTCRDPDYKGALRTPWRSGGCRPGSGGARAAAALGGCAVSEVVWQCECLCSRFFPHNFKNHDSGYLMYQLEKERMTSLLKDSLELFQYFLLIYFESHSFIIYLSLA